MKKVNFIETIKESHFEYHLPCKDSLLDESLFYKQFKLEKEVLGKWNQFLWNSGISYLGTGENSILYSIIIKFLNSKEVIDIATFSGYSELQEHFNPIYLENIEWKNSIEYTTDDSYLCRQYGYQTPLEFLNEMNYFNKDLTNRGFNISRINKENLNSYIKTYSSDVTSWTFFISSDWNRLIETLKNSKKRPEVRQILNFSEYIIDIQIGGDEGYLDYVLIYSKIKLGDEIQVLEKSITRFGELYEKMLLDLIPFDDEWKVDAFKEGLKEIRKVANTM